MKIRRIGGLSGAQLGLAIFLGVASGIYVWKPLFTVESTYKEKQEPKH